MSASGAVDFPNVVMRAPPNIAHLSATSVLQHHHPHQLTPLKNTVASPMQYGSWETRESSPMSDTQSQLMKESMER